MSNSKTTIAERFEAANLATDRFISVKDGEKRSIDHNTRYSDPRDVPGNNYGIYADEDDSFLILDVDYHREGSDDVSTVAMAALGALPRTLKIRSPHVPDEDRGGHRLLKLAGDETPAELFKRRFGKKNPVPSWGEVIAKNKYAVGPGSQLDDCTKEWCDECAEPEGGRYAIKKDRPIAEVDPETLIEALSADPDLEDAEATPDSSNPPQPDSDGSDSPTDDAEYPEFDRETVVEMLDAIPGNQHFDDWIRTGYAVYDWDDGQQGKAVFENWSRTNSKWEKEESQRQIDYIWQEGDANGHAEHNASVGTLVHLAKENGWNPSAPTPKELIVEYSDKYDDVSQVPDSLVSDAPGDSNETDNSGPAGGSENGDNDPPDWRDVRDLYDLARSNQQITKGDARRCAVNVLEDKTSWMYVLESERLWVYDEPSGVYGRFGEAEAARYLVENLEEHYSQTERREIIGQLQDRNQTHREKLNARTHDDPLLCVGNGVINLRTGEDYEHSPEFHFVRGLNWEYDPERASTEPILEFLDDVTERVADRDTLIDHLAHGLMPGHPFRAFVVCYGPGGNGKTQVAELFRGFVGEENAAAVEIDELTSDDFATGDLPGKFLNWGDDMAGDGGGTLQDLSLLKKATGGSKIRANEKYEKTFDFTNEAAMFFSANEPPRIGEQKQSMQDRIYPIEMPYRFVSDPSPDEPMQKEKEPNISEKLLSDDAAMRGLLVLAVEHAQKLIESRGQYSQPESPEERLQKYNQSADPIVRFAGKALQPADANMMVRKDDVYRVYRSFVGTWGERVASERGFKRQFPKAFSEDIESGQSRTLATADDERERVVCWKRLAWTETALSEMPEWMADRYAHHFGEGEDTETSEDSENDTAVTRIENLAPTRGATIEVGVSSQLEPKPWLQAEGSFEDESGVIDYQARDSTAGNPAAELAPGNRYRIENAKITTDTDGVEIVELRGDETITHLGEVVDEKQSAINDSSVDAAADGGEPESADLKQIAHDARDVVKTRFDREEEPVAMSTIAGQLKEYEPRRVKAAVEKAVNEMSPALLIDEGNGKYRPG